MALPTTVLAEPGNYGHHPPYKSSGGNFYCIARDTSIGPGDEARVFKATDPTSSWTEQDSANRPNPGVSIIDGVGAVQDGDVIHMLVYGDSAVYYYTFNMATDLWDVAATASSTQPDNPAFPFASIAVRSDGDVVTVFAGETDKIMGGTKQRVDFRVRTAGVWGGVTALDAGGDVHDGNPNCILGTNDFVHVIWQHTANTTDPPTTWTDTHGRSIDPADDTASTLDISTADTESVLLGYPNLVTYDDGGTQRIIASGFDSAGTTLDTAQATEDANDEILLTATGVTESFTTEPGYANGEAGISTFVELSGDIHCLYSGDGTAGADQDLWYTVSTDNGASWSAPTEEINAITVNYISANIYVRGADTVMAYIYDNAGTQYYNEKILIAGSAGGLNVLTGPLSGPLRGPL